MDTGVSMSSSLPLLFLPHVHLFLTMGHADQQRAQAKHTEAEAMRNQ